MACCWPSSAFAQEAPIAIAIAGAGPGVVVPPPSPATASPGSETESATALPPDAPHPPAMSLADALAYAKSHQPSIRAALAKVRTKRAEAAVPAARWQPRVGVLAEIFAGTANNTTTVYSNRGVVDLPRIGNTTGRSTSDASLRPYASTIAAASIQQEVYDFGRIAAERAALDAEASAAAHESEGAFADLAFNVEEAYFAVAAARQVLRAATEARALALVHRDFAKANVQSGMRPPIDLTRAEADFVQFDTAQARAGGGLRIAQTNLAALIGSPEAAIDVADERIPERSTPSLDAALQQAATRNPQLMQTLAEERAAELAAKAAKAAKRPDLSLSAAISGRAGGHPSSGAGTIPATAGLLPTVPNWDVGLVFTWPIYDAVTDARAKAAALKAEERREVVDQTRRRLEADVRRGLVQVSVAQTALENLGRTRDAARANYAQADARFNAGVGTSVELADAAALRARADVDLALGRFDLVRSRAALGRTLAETK
jgi:outer membrane protein